MFQSSSLSNKDKRKKNIHNAELKLGHRGETFTWLKSRILMPTPAVSSLPRIIQTKRLWRKLLGHPFHIFAGKCVICGMFPWTSLAAAGRTLSCNGMQRGLHLQGEQSIQGQGVGGKLLECWEQRKVSVNEDFCLGNYFYRVSEYKLHRPKLMDYSTPLVY